VTKRVGSMMVLPAAISGDKRIAVGTRISPAPAQIRTGPIKAYGSYLWCVTAKRTLGQG
jgi:hypothetical protein